MAQAAGLPGEAAAAPAGNSAGQPSSRGMEGSAIMLSKTAAGGRPTETPTMNKAAGSKEVSAGTGD